VPAFPNPRGFDEPLHRKWWFILNLHLRLNQRVSSSLSLELLPTLFVTLGIFFDSFKILPIITNAIMTRFNFNHFSLLFLFDFDF
jgi:hypothetical protein